MDTTTLLEQLGLKPREADAYLALLELGEASVQEVAKKSGMQRPNCYAVLESLTKKGLAIYHPKQTPRRYIAEDPVRLHTLLKRREEDLEKALPSLRSLFNILPGKPRLRFYEGLEEVKSLYDEILSSKKIDNIWSPEILTPIAGQNYIENFAHRLVENNIELREIVTGNVLPHHHDGLFSPPRQQVRFYSRSKPAETDLFLYDGKVALISYLPMVHALVIEGSGIVQTIQLMFEAMWDQAK